MQLPVKSGTAPPGKCFAVQFHGQTAETGPQFLHGHILGPEIHVEQRAFFPVPRFQQAFFPFKSGI